MEEFKSRPLSHPADLAAMSALARAFPERNLHTVDLPYRFSSWAFDRPENVCLWEGGNGRLFAWAVLQTPFWALDLSLDPGVEPVLLPRMLEWAETQAGKIAGTPFGRPAWFLSVFAGDSRQIRAAEEAGFASQADVSEDSWSKVLLTRSAERAVPGWGAPQGFVIRPLQGREEILAYTFLHRAVFGSPNMTLEWRMRTLHQPAYRLDLDLVAVDPEGRLAAFCICWLDLDSPLGVTGQIEPLGVSEMYRGLGLGRAILAEGLRRLSQAGAQRILVETDNYRGPALRLYESAGFRVERDVLVFRRDLPT